MTRALRAKAMMRKWERGGWVKEMKFEVWREK
jgi:hypothetical protein